MKAIQVGSVIFGYGAGGQPKLLLVYNLDGDGFWARHVTTQMEFRFDWDGRTGELPGDGSIFIVSTARLPADMHEVALGLDRKWAAKPEYPDTMLSKDEVRLMTTCRAFFEANLLPDE